MSYQDGLVRRYDLGFFLRGLGQPGGNRRVGLDDLLFQNFRTDLVNRAGGHLGGGNAQLLGLHEHFFALQTKFLRYIVNTNGHIYF